MASRNKSIGYWLTRWSQLIPDDTALIEGSKKLTCEDFNTRLNKLANSLRDELNVKKGDRWKNIYLAEVEWVLKSHSEIADPAVVGNFR